MLNLSHNAEYPSTTIIFILKQDSVIENYVEAVSQKYEDPIQDVLDVSSQKFLIAHVIYKKREPISLGFCYREV